VDRFNGVPILQHSVAAEKIHSPLFVGVVSVMKDLDQERQVEIQKKLTEDHREEHEKGPNESLNRDVFR
jgi:hypothetical protein